MKNFIRVASVPFFGFVSGVCAFACSDASSGEDGGGGGAASAGTAPVSSMSGSATTNGGSAVTPPVGTGGSGAPMGVGGSGISTGGGGASSAGAAGAASGGANGGASGGTMGGMSAGGSAGSGGGGPAGMTKGCGATTWPMTKDNNTIMVNGASRSYNLKVPDNYDPKKPYRLMFSFHWLNGTANDISKGSGTAKAWYGLPELDKGTTIFVAPQGINNGWSDAKRTMSKGGDDIDLTKALLTQLEDTLCIDTKRIFAEGFSMGGSMSYAVACALGDVFRGVAVHSGGPMSGCVTPHTKPVAYFMTHGTSDSVCTYPGYGVPQLQDFAKVNGCMDATLPKPTSSAAACVDFMGCSAGYPTRSCLFVGDHTPSPGGTANTWVPAETWKFISQF
jgi:poly(3-hydroxybutyrate) depolymerase